MQHNCVLANVLGVNAFDAQIMFGPIAGHVKFGISAADFVAVPVPFGVDKRLVELAIKHYLSGYFVACHVRQALDEYHRLLLHKQVGRRVNNSVHFAFHFAGIFVRVHLVDGKF